MTPFVAAIVFALLAVAAASNVVVLTKDTFDDAIKNNEFILVEFYAPWCGHCKNLAPEYEKAATALKEAGVNVVLANVDATVDGELAQKFGVRGYPTLKWFKNGVATEYTGGRTESTIVSWINKKVSGGSKKLATSEELTTFQNSADVVAVGFFAAGSAEEKVFADAGNKFEDVSFAVVNDEAVAAAAGAKVPAVVVFQKFDAGRVDFDGDLTSADAIHTFVSNNLLPLVVAFSQQTSSKIFGGSVNTHLLAFTDKSLEGFDAQIATLTAIAKAYKGRALVVTIGKGQERVYEFFGLTIADAPTVRLVKMGEGSMRKYEPATSALEEAALTAFLNAYFAGELKPVLKSEEVPASNDGPVTVVVGKNFESVVLDTTKDVLIEFYAPWCGHCKNLAPIWDALGAKFAGVSSIVIAKMDATANEHELVDVGGFPTIKFWPANDKANPIDYEGGRDEASFIRFLEARATIPFTLSADDAAEEPEEDGDHDEL